MTTQAEKFKEIADAIRLKTGGSDEIAANDFASEIQTIDRLKPMTNYPDGLTCGYYGNRAAKIAATYHLARLLGEDTFNYSQTGNIFSNNTSATKTVRNADGLGQIDCSSLVSLVLRGITYDKSPYALHKGANATWNPSKELSGMYGEDGWEFTILDKQPEGFFNNLGISGYSSVKSAADIGEYFYKYGYVIFDSKVDGEMTAAKAVEMQSKLEPGDLLFWAKPTASDAQKSRFRSISHVAIVAENTTHFLEVTTGSSVVLYSTFDSKDDDGTDDKFNYISLICRPDYRPRKSAEKTPIGINLLHYPWVYGALKTSVSNGITFTVKDEHTIHISGTNTAQISRRLRGNDETGTCLPLSAGTYKLSGMDNVGINHVGVALQVRKADGTDFDEKIRCFTGTNPTFTLSKDTDVVVVLYFGENDGKGYTVDCDVTPTLVRIS